MASKRELRRRIEDAEARASAVFGLSGPSAVEKMAKMLEARRLLLDGRKPGEYLEPDADQIADVAHQTGITADEIRKVVSVHNTVLRDFELNY